MEVGGKIFAGAAATLLLGLASHAMNAETIVDRLEQSAKSELEARGLEGVEVNIGRDPLSRSVVLDGDVADDTKQEALAAIRTLPGIGNASWLGDEPVTSDTDGTESGPVSEAAVAECQKGVDSIVESQKINFRSGSAYVSPEANRILDQVAEALKNCDGLAIAIGGHTDDNGDALVNKTMSQERADRVMAGLVDRGIDAKLLSATGFGSDNPLVEGSDAAADAQNRRIEFTVGAAANDADPQQGG